MVREIREELGLDSSLCLVPSEPATVLDFTAASVSAGVETRYILSVYAVCLTSPEAEALVAADPNHRWLTADEIEQGQTSDGRLVSATMLRLLDALP